MQNLQSQVNCCAPWLAVEMVQLPRKKCAAASEKVLPRRSGKRNSIPHVHADSEIAYRVRSLSPKHVMTCAFWQGFRFRIPFPRGPQKTPRSRVNGKGCLRRVAGGAAIITGRVIDSSQISYPKS